MLKHSVMELLRRNTGKITDILRVNTTYKNLQEKEITALRFFEMPL
jgi:hypothetical protein